MNSMMYGPMTEEIDYSCDGGLYGELVRNSNFREDPKEPWQLVHERGGAASMTLDSSRVRDGKIPNLPSPLRRILAEV